MRSQYATVAGEPFVFMGKPQSWYDGSRICLFSVGYSGTAVSALSGETGKLMRKIAEVMPVASLNAGGLGTMGNDTAVNSIEAAAQALRTLYGPRTPPFVLVGISMGFADMMNWARTHQGQVSGAIGGVGLTDLQAVYDANPDLGGGVMAQTEVNAAYGGAFTPAIAAVRSPKNFAANMSFPITYLYSTDDPLISPASSAVFGALSNVEDYSLGPVQHGTTAIKAIHEHPKFVEKVAAYAAR